MPMNIFRLCADMSHVVAIIIILHQLVVKEHGRQFSSKTQQLFLIVFVTRYLDLFTTYYSFYNSIMKIFYLTSSVCVLKMMHLPSGNLRHKVNHRADAFHHWKYCLLPACTFAFITYTLSHHNYHSYYLNLFWRCSIALEAVALIPQLYIIYRNQWNVHISVKEFVWK